MPIYVYCPTCRQPVLKADYAAHREQHRREHGPWSTNRDTAAHARFARAVKKRDNHRCVVCGTSEDVRAAHIVPISKGGSYHPSNGRTLCRKHDRATDPYAR